MVSDCAYDGQTYAHDTIFTAADDCNICMFSNCIHDGQT